MSGDDLTIALFLFGTAIAFGLTAVTLAGWTNRVLVVSLFGVAVVLFVCSIFWTTIGENWAGLRIFLHDLIANYFGFRAIGLVIFLMFCFDFAIKMGWISIKKLENVTLQNKNDATQSSPQRNNTSRDPIYFTIQKSHLEVSCREFHGKSIIRCAAVATNKSQIYLDGCKFTAKTKISVFERASEEFSGNMPLGRTARLHLFDLLIQNIDGEFLGYRFLDNSEFRTYSGLAIIKLRFVSKEAGHIKKIFHVRGIMEASEYVITSDDQEERQSIIDSLTPDDEL